MCAGLEDAVLDVRQSLPDLFCMVRDGKKPVPATPDYKRRASDPLQPFGNIGVKHTLDLEGIGSGPID